MLETTGFCACGCGTPTLICKKTSTRDKTKRGVPLRFIRGHQLRAKRPTQCIARGFKIDGEYCRLIPISRGLYAIIEERDFDTVSRFVWSARWNPHTRSFYAFAHDEGAPGRPSISMHRLILGLKCGDSRLADHVESGQTLDNRRANLRVATFAENAANARRKKTSLTGYKGVKRVNQKFVALICSQRTRVHLGTFDDAISAHHAYRKAAKEKFGAFARYE